MRYLHTCLLLSLILTANAFAQGDSELKFFRGGTYNLDLSLSNSLFMGVGSRVGSLGGDYGGLVRSSEALLWNPANLARMQTSQLTLDFIPKLMLNPASFFDMDSEIHTSVDDNIEDVKSDGLVLDDEDYPTVGVNVGDKGSFGNGSFAYHTFGLTVAGALYQPVNWSIDMVGTGFEAQMATLDAEDPTKDVTFYTSVDMSGFARLKLQGATLGFGMLISPRWSLGMGIERWWGMAQANGQFQIEGIMLLAGAERAFNDPGDPWENDLGANLRLKYEGAATRYRLGVNYKLGRKWGVGAALATGVNLEMGGELDWQYYTMEGLKLDAEDDEDLLDPTEIDLDEPTKTVLEESPVANRLELNSPGSLGIGISGQVAFIGMSLNLTRYFGEWSYRYEVTKDDEQDLYYRGLRFENGVNLGLDFKLFRLGAGVTTATFLERASHTTGDRVYVPNLAIGTGFRISKVLRSDVLFIGVPSGVGKISIHYDL